MTTDVETIIAELVSADSTRPVSDLLTELSTQLGGRSVTDVIKMSAPLYRRAITEELQRTRRILADQQKLAQREAKLAAQREARANGRPADPGPTPDEELRQFHLTRPHLAAIRDRSRTHSDIEGASG